MKICSKKLHSLILPGLLALGVTGASLAVSPAVYAALPAEVNGQPVPSLSEMLKKVMPTVVNIAAQGEIRRPLNPFARPGATPPPSREFESLGSGVIIDARNGYIVTNEHVLRSTDSISVTLSDGRIFKAKLIGADPASDVAILRIQADHLTAAQLGNSDALKVGDFVAAIGNPFGLNQTVTSGIVSGLQRNNLGIEGYENFIQTDASINPGNSGGALVDLQGQVIGINTAIIGPRGGNIGIGFAIPINMAKGVIEQLIKYGSVNRGLIGVSIQDLTPALADAFRLSGQTGCLVPAVAPNSAAAAAGIKAGDIIIEVNGEKITSAGQARNAIGMLRVGNPVDLKILRNGKIMSFSLNTADPKQFIRAAEENNPYLFGMSLNNFAQQTINQGFVTGVQVLQISEKSAAWRAGIRPGDVIVSANQTPVSAVADLQKIARSDKQQLLLNLVRPNSGGAAFVVLKGN